MFMKVIKRNGSEVEFDKLKIIAAITGAFLEQNEYIDEDMAGCIAKIADNIEATAKTKTLHVEEIQDLVEKRLMSTKYKSTAKAYINYRYLHGLARDNYRELMAAVDEKLSAANVQNQNANLDEKSFGGRVGEMADLVAKKYALEYLVSPMARANHENNEIYIHDLNSYAVGSHNCLSIPFDDLLANGFNTRQTDVRPAQSINTAFQLVALIFQIQSLQQFGGVSATHLDWTMVPYMRKSFAKHYKDGWRYFSDFDAAEIDYSIENMINNATHYSIEDREWKAYCHKAYQYAMDMTERELVQAVEGFMHNCNTLQSRSGNQLPFSSINYGTCTLPEGRLVTKALLEASINGVGKLHKTSIFPCGIFQCMKGVNRKPDDPNYDLFKLALKSTSLRLYPNYCNCDWGGNAGYDINDPRTYMSSMGCRTVNGFDINGFGQLKDGRGNVCPVTIILPTLAMQALQEEQRLSKIRDGVVNNCDPVELFIDILDRKIHEAKDMLIERFEWICSQSPEAAKFMYENNTMAGYIPEEGIRSALKHGTLALGQLGLAETLQILIGCDHTEERGMELAKRIEQLFKDRCAEFKEEYKLNFGVYFTPRFSWVA
jgi:ribonucleoside-triphosphate reductase